MDHKNEIMLIWYDEMMVSLKLETVKRIPYNICRQLNP